MHEAVEDRVGQRGIPQGLMPVLDWELTGHQRGPAIMAVCDDLQPVATVFIMERREAPVIQHATSSWPGSSAFSQSVHPRWR
jgi:hypothetical protein